MEFDKSRVYTALNADELEIGSKVIFANSMQTLKNTVELVVDTLHTLKGVRDEGYSARFFDGDDNWYLAYLIEEPKIKLLEWTDLKVGDVIRRKFYDGYRTALVTVIDTCTDTTKHVGLTTYWLDDSEIAEWKKVEDNK